MTLSVRDAAREFPDRIALVVGDLIVTFAELAARVERRIESFAKIGLDAATAEPVALVGKSDLGTLELVYAFVEIGKPVALIHPRLTETEREPLLLLVRPSHVIERAPAFEEPGAAPVAQRVGANQPVAVDPERTLGILFTSGTTGRPKGVVLSRRAFIASASGSELNLGWQDGNRWLLGLPIAHVGGLSILTRCLLGRRTVVVPGDVAEGKALSVDALVAVIETRRVTIASLVPTQLERLFSERPTWSPPAHLRAVLLGGAAARPALLERAASAELPVLTTYGATETCSQVTTQLAGTVNRGELGVGFPIASTEIRVVKDVVQVRGPTLLTNTIPPRAEPLLDGEGWFRTDDLGRLDDAGRLHVLGRKSDLIITGGENVYPAEVEAALERCPGILGACVFGVPDDTWGELVAAALVVSRTESDVLGVLGSHLNANVAKHRRPRRVAFLTQFETTQAGKLDRAGTARRATPLLRPLDPT